MQPARLRAREQGGRRLPRGGVARFSVRHSGGQRQPDARFGRRRSESRLPEPHREFGRVRRVGSLLRRDGWAASLRQERPRFRDGLGADELSRPDPQRRQHSARLLSRSQRDDPGRVRLAGGGIRRRDPSSRGGRNPARGLSGTRRLRDRGVVQYVGPRDGSDRSDAASKQFHPRD